MKIQFIGTGNISSISNSASVLINDHILFDIPNGNLKAMIRQNIDISKIDTIIISHTHADHCFDIPFFLWYKANYAEESITNVITDEITKETIEGLIKLSYFNSAKKAKKKLIDCKKVEKIGRINIKTEEMNHKGIKNANGYEINDNDIKIGLTGDTAFCKEVRNLASKVDYLISDMTLECGDNSHMGIDNITELLKEYPNLKIIPIHMHDKIRKKAQTLKLKNLIMVEDGTVLEV